MKTMKLASLIGIGMALFPPLLTAQTTELRAARKPIEEVLKDIPRADTVCRKDEPVPAAAPVAARASRPLDLACAATLEQLSASLDRSDTMIIDTRQAADFAKYHINNAVNLTPAEIATKPYLLAKSLVLIGDGKDDQDQMAACSELRGAGFKKTRVLSGGLVTWLQDRREMIGAVPDFGDLASLSPAELFREASASGSVVLGLPATRRLADALPAMVVLPSASGAALGDYLLKRKGTLSGKRIVLVADEHFDQRSLVDLAAAAKPVPVFVYARTEAEYRAFLRNQTAMWAKQAKGPVVRRCGA